MTNAFVLGAEPFNVGLLETVRQPHATEYIPLLSAEEAVEVQPGFSFESLVEHADARLRANGQADAILNYWDFPGSCLAPLLSQRHRLSGPSLESVTTFEHKYWARCEMAAAVPEATPKFCAIDPFANEPVSQLQIDYPFWIKPVVSHSSYLGFKIDDEDALAAALETIRGNIRNFGDAFDEFLQHVDVPDSIAEVGGQFCIAEEIISGDHQVTLEGYVQNGKLVPIGWIDSLRGGPAGSSFSCYSYPSRLPETIRTRMQILAERLLRRSGYDNAPFNIEFFWHEEADRISILEVNTRISKSHCPLFLLVDGRSHQQVALDLALGRTPDFPARRGEWPYAAKFMVRLFQDGQVIRVPNASQIDCVREQYPEAYVQILVTEGQRLSEMSFQDSYSYEIADIFLGCADDADAKAKFSDIVERLPFEFKLIAPET